MTTVAVAPSRRAVHRRLAAVLAAVAVLVTACSSDPEPATPEQALVAAVEDTFEGAFAYRVVAEADRAALEDLGAALGSVAARLNVFEVSGIVDGEVVTVDLRVFGTQPLAQLRRYGDDEVYVRMALGDGPLGALATPELQGRLLGLAAQTDQPPSIVEALGALFDGAWIGLVGEFDADMLTGRTRGASEPDDADAPLSTPLPDVVADYIGVLDQVTEDGTTTYRVDLRVRALLRALASLGGGLDAAGIDGDAFEENLQVLPELVTGDVVIVDGVVEAVVFDVAAAAREAGDDITGSLELRLELSDHGQPDVPAAPDPAVTVPSADLAAGLAQLLATDGS